MSPRAIKGAGRQGRAAITDGRFSGGTTGLCVGHVAPEAVDGGPIALRPRRRPRPHRHPQPALDLLVDEAELAAAPGAGNRCPRATPRRARQVRAAGRVGLPGRGLRLSRRRSARGRPTGRDLRRLACLIAPCRPPAVSLGPRGARRGTIRPRRQPARPPGRITSMVPCSWECPIPRDITPSSARSTHAPSYSRGRSSRPHGWLHAASLLATSPVSAAEDPHPQEAPVYKVVQEGMTLFFSGEGVRRSRQGRPGSASGRILLLRQQRTVRQDPRAGRAREEAGRA